MLDYNEILRRIKPSKIICYGRPFDEMKSDITGVDYGKANNLSKGFFIKTFEPLHKGKGSARGRSWGIQALKIQYRKRMQMIYLKTLAYHKKY